MANISQYFRGDSKKSNTFLHVSLQNVIDIYNLKAFKYSDETISCHKSQYAEMIACEILKNKNPRTYREIHKNKCFTAQCVYQFDEPQYSLLPVHLE